jgi:hypothetical protein
MRTGIKIIEFIAAALVLIILLAGCVFVAAALWYMLVV